MNFLLESIITYRLPLPLFKMSASLSFNDVFCCAGVRLNLGGAGGDNGGSGGGDDDSYCLV